VHGLPLDKLSTGFLNAVAWVIFMHRYKKIELIFCRDDGSATGFGIDMFTVRRVEQQQN